jgi:hypothetical protein
MFHGTDCRTDRHMKGRTWHKNNDVDKFACPPFSATCSDSCVVAVLIVCQQLIKDIVQFDICLFGPDELCRNFAFGPQLQHTLRFARWDLSFSPSSLI